jgi:alpha-L-fucosidase
MPPGGLDEYWETPQTLNKTWGFSKYDTLWKSPEDVIRRLVGVVSRGGNYLLNIGPKGNGEIPDTTIKIFRKVGLWMERNSESIYGTTANPFGELSWGYCTVKGSRIYLFVRDWPEDNVLAFQGLQNPVTSAYLLADESTELKINRVESTTYITIPTKSTDDPLPVLTLEIEGALTFDPPTVVQDEAGQIELNYLTASTRGRAMTRFNRKGGYHISKWKGPDDAVDWSIDIDKPGKFKVSINYAANKEWEGKPFEITVGKSYLEKSVIYTGGFFDYQEFPAGYFEFTKSGRYTLTIRPKELSNTYLMYLRSIKLSPVKTIKQAGWSAN